MLDGEHATKLKRNIHIKLVLFLIVILSYKNYLYTRKATFNYESSFSFPFSFFGKITYENEIAVSTKNIIAQTWLTRLAALFKTIPESNQLPHCSNGTNPYAKKKNMCTPTNKTRCNTQFLFPASHKPYLLILPVLL